VTEAECSVFCDQELARQQKSFPMDSWGEREGAEETTPCLKPLDRIFCDAPV